MHSWNEYYTYLGYTYVLEHDEDGDVRKNIHIVLDTNKKEIDISSEKKTSFTSMKRTAYICVRGVQHRICCRFSWCNYTIMISSIIS